MDLAKREVKIDRAEYLRSIELFQNLERVELEEISNILKSRSYEKNSIIVSEGSDALETYIVKFGKVKIYKTDANGREVIMAIKGSGKPFAEALLFTGGKYPATVKAMEDTDVYVIDNGELEGIVENCPRLSLNLIKVMSKRLLRSQQRVREFATDDVYMRLARELLYMAQVYGVAVGDGIEIDLSLNREELAGLIGTTRETVSRALSRFSKENSIELVGKKIRIVDAKKLKGWLG